MKLIKSNKTNFLKKNIFSLINFGILRIIFDEFENLRK